MTQYTPQSPEVLKKANAVWPRIVAVDGAVAELNRAIYLSKEAENTKHQQTNLAVKNVGHISTQDAKNLPMFSTPYTPMLKDLSMDKHAREIITGFNPHNIPHTVPELNFNTPPMLAPGLPISQPSIEPNILNAPVGQSTFLDDARRLVYEARQQ